MAKTATRKYLTTPCATCGRKLVADPSQYIYSRFTGSRYCLSCCVNPPKKKRRIRT